VPLAVSDSVADALPQAVHTDAQGNTVLSRCVLCYRGTHYQRRSQAGVACNRWRDVAADTAGAASMVIAGMRRHSWACLCYGS